MIPFSRPFVSERALEYVKMSLESGRTSGDHDFSRLCHAWLEQKIGIEKALLTPSATHALEMAAFLLEVGPGDEVIMPSFTFPSTATAIVIRGARPVFVDIDPATMNLSVEAVANAISPMTKGIVVVHYAGTSCNMEALTKLASAAKLWLVEDAAQALLSNYKGKPLGSFGDVAALSFHETKNISCGEGGAVLVNGAGLKGRAEIIREKGTNRAQFFRGQVAKYNWVDIGSSYLMSDVNAAILWAQLEMASVITEKRIALWNQYQRAFTGLMDRGLVELLTVPVDCQFNAHIFGIKAKDLVERSALLSQLRSDGISAAFHYVPLHTSPAGMRYGEFRGEDRFTTRESERLLRLPLYAGMNEDDQGRVIEAVCRFYG